MRYLSALSKKLLCGVAMATAAVFSSTVAAADHAVAPPALAQRVYVWQRTWTPAVRQSVQDHGPVFAGIDVLVTELSFRATPASVVSTQPDWPSLLSTGRPVGVVIRAGSYPGALSENSSATALVVGACAKGLALARAAGIEPAELQIDFDAATSRLADYRTWLHAVRQEIHPARLVITVLPDWLRSADFRALVHEVDAYVLQVHSLEKPVGPTQPFSLCDPMKTAAWIREASAIGVPFRVALPSYGYRVAFGPEGKFIGLQAEGPARTWPAGSSVRTILADPAPLARLVQTLQSSPPPLCEGLVWFRLPSADDELAWRWTTLIAVMTGANLDGRLALAIRENDNGALDLTLGNPGDVHAKLSGFRLRWHDATLVAADAIGGWRLERIGPGELIVRPPAEAANDLLFPNDRREIGWMRLSARAAVNAVPLK